MKIEDNKLSIITEPNLICFVLPKDTGNNLKHETDFFVERNKFLAEHAIKKKISKLLLKYRYVNDIHE